MLRKPPRPTPDTSNETIAIAIGALFTLCGCWLLCAHVLAPLWETRQAARWRSTTCTITAAEVVSQRDRDGELEYAPRIVYAYTVDGVAREGARVSFGDRGFGDDRDDAAAVVARYRRGEAVACFYDPASPAEVVLDRTAPGVAVLALAACGLLLAGLGVAVTAARRAQAARRQARETSPPGLAALTLLGERRGGALLQWAGVAALFAAGAVVAATRAPMPVAMLFGAAALALLIYVWHRLLRELGTRVDARVEGVPRLGGAITVAIDVRGWTPIRTARARLIGREEVVHPGGTYGDGVTERAAFFEVPLAEVTRPGRAARLAGAVQIPRDKVPSFAAARQRVRWVIAIEADLAVWPDVAEEHELQVGPAEIAAAVRDG